VFPVDAYAGRYFDNRCLNFRITAAIRYNTTGFSLDEKLLHGDSARSSVKGV
jgi:hypothetical protein